MKPRDCVAAASISSFIRAHCFCGPAGSFHHNNLMLNTDKYNPMWSFCSTENMLLSFVGRLYWTYFKFGWISQRAAIAVLVQMFLRPLWYEASKTAKCSLSSVFLHFAWPTKRPDAWTHCVKAEHVSSQVKYNKMDHKIINSERKQERSGIIPIIQDVFCNAKCFKTKMK